MSRMRSISLLAAIGALHSGATEGAVVIPGRLFVDITRSLPGEEVAIEHRSGEGLVEITSGTRSTV